MEVGENWLGESGNSKPIRQSENSLKVEFGESGWILFKKSNFVIIYLFLIDIGDTWVKKAYDYWCAVNIRILVYLLNK